MPNFQIKQGIDKNWYMVFIDGWDCELAWKNFNWCELGYRIASFGQFYNAIQLTE